ncbi:alpha/beta hydrolase [Pseudarthrobacter sp. J75]|uniref:alpha/beta fold hydrolase n=1 Tax=unclassified Pseudarthrobacter TaxID=2647000 RepID=UPI002E816356|nr:MULTISPECIES: alpha/beta hydrolase [unclassified Pseudarthrobacter]MEE2524032.1 alpha/beta hydrolase [Pseudarthrobacter sp. J47]MEE2530605.1 alpha/beta hydrolase [Pseudarthrobacter sp. J75]
MFKQRIVFVHGAGQAGSAAWPRQHGMALDYDALFLRRHGFDPAAVPVESFAEDVSIVLRSLADDGRGAAGGHVVAHGHGAIAAMMAAVERPDLVFSLVLVEPDCLSLTADLPATSAHIALMKARLDEQAQTGEAPPWEAPLQIVPGVPTLVLTGGWEPLYEEIAGYLRETGALHRVAAGGHRPQDSPEGDHFIRTFIAEASRRRRTAA